MNPNYLANLSPQQRLLQQSAIRKSQKEYQETGLVIDRKPVSSAKPPRSNHAAKFERQYGLSVTNLPKVKKLFPDTDVSEILARGRAAYSSSGSRPNVSSFAWAFARLASVLTGGKALTVDKDLVGPVSLSKIKSPM